jgi:phosphomethylpyrimidine synthase
MQISHHVRDFAAEHGIQAEEAISVGLEQKAMEFRQGGGNIYTPADNSRFEGNQTS